MIKKLESFIPTWNNRPNLNYYEPFPIKPGPYMFYAFIKSKLPFSLLKAKFPETMCIFEDVAWIRYDYTTGENKLFKEEIPLWNFYDYVYETESTILNHEYEDKNPAAVEHKYGEYPIHDD